MITAAKMKPDELKTRVILLKKDWPENKDYIPVYETVYGEQEEDVKNRIRAVWNLRVADEEITENLEKLAQKLSA